MEIEKRNHKGCSYTRFVLGEKYDSVSSFGSDRLVINGKVGVVLMEGSWKFGKQIQFIVEGDNFTLEKRNMYSKINRVEIDIDSKHIDDLIFALQNIKRLMEDGIK